MLFKVLEIYSKWAKAKESIDPSSYAMPCYYAPFVWKCLSLPRQLSTDKAEINVVLFGIIFLHLCHSAFAGAPLTSNNSL